MNKAVDLVYGPWTTPSSIHGGKITMVGAEAYRSSAIGHSSHWEGAPLVLGDGGGSSEAHQWWNSAVELVNLIGNEVML
jgi:hypothetical protein